MPVLNAGGYNVLQFPTKEPEARQAQPFQEIQTNANMFGAGVGAALQELGNDAERASAHMDNIANLHNQVVVDDTTNKVEDNINKVLYGDPAKPGDNGYFGLRGEAAVKAFPEVRKVVDDIVRQHRGLMQNTPQALAFDSATRAYRNNALATTGRHYENEYKTYDADATKGRLTLNHGNISTAAANGDWDSFITFTNKDQDDIEKAGARQGLPRETIDAMKQDRHKAAAKEWTQSLATRDAVAADKFIEDNKDALGDLYPDLKNQVHARAKTQQAEDDFAGKPSDPNRNRVIGGQPPAPVVKGEVIPFTPKPETLSAVGFNGAQYDTLRQYLAGRESSSYAQPPSPGHSHIGRYQFGPTEIQETATRMGIPVPSTQEFLGNPTLQEQMFENYTLDHHNTLMNNPAYASASPERKAGLLAGAHLLGVGAVNKFLASGEDGTDANGTRISSYVNGASQAMHGAPMPARPQTVAAESGDRVEVWGDSLGVGLQHHVGGGKGYAVSGASPSVILANIKSKPEEYWAGKTIVLPSGSNREANAADTIPKVEETIKYLQDHDARVIAVGYGKNYKERNAQLREVATRLGVPVIDAQGDDGVHPSPTGYRSMATAINAATAKPPTAIGEKISTDSPTSVAPSTGDQVIGGRPSLGANAAGIYAADRPMTPGTDVVLPAPAQATPVAPVIPRAQKDRDDRENFADRKGGGGMFLNVAAGGPVDQYIPPPREENMYQDNEVPGLESKLREFDKRAAAEGWTQERYIAAYDYARKRMNQAYADQQHRRTADRQAVEDQDNKVHDEYLGRMAKDSPNYPTTDEVKLDKRLSAKGKETIISSIMRDTKPEPTGRQSAAAEVELSKRMYLPEDDTNRIGSEKQIMQEWWNQKIDVQARDKLIKDLRELQGTKEPEINRKANNLISSLERKIRPVKVILDEGTDAIMDPESAERMRRYKDYVASEIQRHYRTEGKNPNELFDAKSPNYLGREEVVKDFLPEGGDPIKGLLDKPKAGGVPPTMKPNPLAAPVQDLNTIPGLQKEVAAGRMTREQAIAIARQKGLTAPPGPTAPAR